MSEGKDRRKRHNFRAVNALQRVKRRNQAVRLYLTGQYSMEEIASLLNCAKSTVSEDISFQKKQWEQGNLSDRDGYVKLELARLGQTELLALTELLRAGDVRGCCDVLLNCVKHRTKLLGLEATVRWELSNKVGGSKERPAPVTDEQLEDIIRRAGTRQRNPSL